MKKSAARRPLILCAYPQGEHLDLFTVLEERKEVHTQHWERMAPPVTATRKTLAGKIGSDTSKFQNIILCIDSSHCFLQTLTLPTSEPKEVDSMVKTNLSLFPVLDQPEYAHSHAILDHTAHSIHVLSATFRKDELIPLLEKVEKWGVDLPVVVPDAWAVWRYLALHASDKLPGQYVWIWMDPATDEQNVVLKFFVIDHGQPRFVFQPFVPRSDDKGLALSITQFFHFAAECARREGEVLAEDLPVYFSSYHLELDPMVAQIDLHNHPRHLLPLEFKPQECAALVWQKDSSQWKNWLPDFWKDYQTQRYQKRRRARIIKGICLIYVASLLVFLGFIFHQKNEVFKQQETTAFQRPLYDKAIALKKQVARMRTQAEGNQNALDVLYLTTQAMPKELTLTGYSFKFQEGLSLRGFASNNEKVYDFVEALKKTKPFQSVVLNSVRNNPQKNWVEFDIQCNLGAQQQEAGRPAESTNEPPPVKKISITPTP